MAGIHATFKPFKKSSLQIETRNMEGDAIAVVKEHLDYVISQVREYPKARPHRADGTWYMRTHLLYKGWRTRIFWSNGAIGEIYNEAPYAGYVQGDEQTPLHAAQGWRKLSDYLYRARFHTRCYRFMQQRIRQGR